MKRISILVMAFMVLFSCSAFAENWQWVDSNDSVGFFFDSDSVKYQTYTDFSTNGIKYNRLVKSYWVKIVYTQKGANELAEDMEDESFKNVSFSIEKWTSNKESITNEFIRDYNNEGRLIYINNTACEEPIIPESFGKEVVDAVNMFCFANDDQVIRNSMH